MVNSDCYLLEEFVKATILLIFLLQSFKIRTDIKTKYTILKNNYDDIF